MFHLLWPVFRSQCAGNPRAGKWRDFEFYGLSSFRADWSDCASTLLTCGVCLGCFPMSELSAHLESHKGHFSGLLSETCGEHFWGSPELRNHYRYISQHEDILGECPFFNEDLKTYRDLQDVINKYCEKYICSSKKRKMCVPTGVFHIRSTLTGKWLCEIRGKYFLGSIELRNHNVSQHEDIFGEFKFFNIKIL